ncbi:hypothetical protein SAMN05421734_10116 [Pelagirhabdus alkalitolerans]|uniref:Uncharacterized protein n=1 Tax=Pelagirhabdus alkalitolerans TaxID=1612202 RepID=A0A1G6GG92_9BACI|nr:hypothetical protein [Pelagirhabdus alkalitolerans]SDB80909.1 hypothetical protein SAMN05421734_10116 [Pelagirhabdus alkalitolerans]
MDLVFHEVLSAASRLIGEFDEGVRFDLRQVEKEGIYQLMIRSDQGELIFLVLKKRTMERLMKRKKGAIERYIRDQFRRQRFKAQKSS